MSECIAIVADNNDDILAKENFVFVEDSSLEFVGGGTITNIL